MNLEDSIGLIELGNTNLKCLIFKINKDNNSEILSVTTTPSDGIYNDVVVNLKKASDSIRLAISTAEKKAKVSLKKINVIFEQPDFLCTRFSKHKKIDDSKIHRSDIEFLLNEGKKQLMLNDKNQSIIHIFNHNYIVDGKIFIEEPINVFADTLTHEMTFITAPKNNLRNVNQIFLNCDIEIERLISQTFALGVELFDERELQSGVVLINLGLKKISLGLFKNLALVHSITFPIGVDHITSDISKVCSLNLEESLAIRNNIDFSFENNKNIFDENNILKKSFFINSKFRKISKDLIYKVIRARTDEILEMIKKQLKVTSFNFSSGMNFFLIGEGSNFINLQEYCQNFFELNTVVGRKDNLEKGFSACQGGIRIIKEGWETEAIPEIKIKNIEKVGFLRKIFGDL
ncbi:cell division protein FtsA [Pelagibacteraceae bacterium]|nr:cell division protein FtsA [Pelagibacteraceae bacterium]